MTYIDHDFFSLFTSPACNVKPSDASSHFLLPYHD